MLYSGHTTEHLYEEGEEGEEEGEEEGRRGRRRGRRRSCILFNRACQYYTTTIWLFSAKTIVIEIISSLPMLMQNVYTLNLSDNDKKRLEQQ